MPYSPRYNRAVIVTQPIFRDGKQYYQLLHGLLKNLHHFALEQLGLNSADFDVDENGQPCYWLLVNQQPLAVRSGATPISFLDDEATILRANLGIELYRNPEMGKLYAERMENEASQADAAVAQARLDDKARRLNWFSRKQTPQEKSSAESRKARQAKEYAEYRKECG